MKKINFLIKNRINSLIILLALFSTEYSYSQLSSPNGVIDLRSQNLIGDNNSALFWDSNNSDLTQLIFRDKEHTKYGNVCGSGNGAHFGLKDGDGQWSYLASKDANTDFRINNAVIMRLWNNGNVGINQNNAKENLHIGQQLTFRSPDTNGGWGGLWVNCYWDNAAGGSTKRIVNDEVAQMTITDDGGILFRTAAAGPAGSNVNPNDFTHNMKILNGGGVNVCGTIRANEVIIEEGWWCDFVFDDSYALPSIEEQMSHIDDKGYLANFQSEEEMAGEVSLGDVTIRQQQTIEELMLYIGQLNGANKLLKAENEKLDEKFDDLQNLVLAIQAEIKQ